MELHQLEILRELGSLGSLTAVADTLRVTPSAVSQQLAALQREFQVPLTRREGRTLALTDAGRALAHAGADVIDAMAAARGAVAAFERSESGRVRLCGFHSAAQALFGPLIAELRDRDAGPDLRLSDEDVAQDDFPALTAHYDLVLAHRLKHSAPWPSTGVEVIPLLQEPLDIALPVDHPLTAHAELSPLHLAREPWVASRAGYSPDDLLGAIAALADTPLNVVHRVNDYASAASIIAAGAAIGLVPRYTVGSAHDGLVLRPLIGLNATRNVDLLTRPENLHRRSVQTVVAALRATIAQLVQLGDERQAR